MITKLQKFIAFMLLLLMPLTMMLGCTTIEQKKAEIEFETNRSSYAEDKPGENTTYEVLSADSFSIDGNMIRYSDDVYSLHWDSTKWNYCFSTDGCVTLEKRIGTNYPLIVKFSVLSTVQGVPSDMWSYANKAMSNYYEIPDIISYTFLAGDLEVPFEGCTGLATGVRYEYPEDESMYSNVISTVYAITNAENSAVIAISVYGSNEAIETIMGEWQASENFYTESHKYVEDLMMGFSLSNR